jgi:hypothetical protein
MRVRWRQSWGDVFDLLLKDRDLGLLLIIAVLGALVGLAALFGVLMYVLLQAARQLFKDRLGRVLRNLPALVRFRANRTLSRHRRMTESDPSRTSGR